MKYEWRKHAPYKAKTKPEYVEVSTQQYLMIAGAGDPNEPDFSEHVGALYSLAYPLKMNFKKFAQTIDWQAQYPYEDYTVFPLEGLWSTTNPEDLTDKASFTYQIMLRQPDFITQEWFAAAIAQAKAKKPHPYLDEVRLVEITDGPAVQILHKGPFDTEPASFAKLDQLCQDLGLTRRGYHHREIYLTDVRKTAPEKAKTILRYFVEKA